MSDRTPPKRSLPVIIGSAVGDIIRNAQVSCVVLKWVGLVEWSWLETFYPTIIPGGIALLLLGLFTSFGRNGESK